MAIFRKTMSIGIMVSIFLTAIQSTALANFSHDHWLETLAPSYLVPDVLERLVWGYEGTHEEQARFERVDRPILKGVLRKIVEGLSVADHCFVTNQSGDQAPDRLANYQALLEALRCVGGPISGENFESMRRVLQNMTLPDEGHRFVLDARRYGRWSEFSTTMMHPWVWDRIGMDVMGMAKIIPFGPLILEDEKKRYNIGGVSNRFLGFISWFYVAYKLALINVPLEVAFAHLVNDTKQFVQQVYQGNLTAIEDDWFVNQKKYAQIFGGVGVVKELLIDVGEVIRGPAIMVVLGSQGEFSLVGKVVLSYVGEMYDLLNRNRKFFSLIPHGSAYLFAFLDLIAPPLLLFDCNNFYWQDTHARYEALLEQEGYTPKFYGELLSWVGKALTPVFVVTQYYDKDMLRYTYNILRFMGDNIPVIGPFLKHLFLIWLPQVANKPSVKRNLQLLSAYTGVGYFHGLMRDNGAMIYNIAMWLSGAAGTVLAGMSLFYNRVENMDIRLSQSANYLAMFGASALTALLYYSAEIKAFSALGGWALASTAAPVISLLIGANPIAMVATVFTANVFMLMYADRLKNNMIWGFSYNQLFVCCLSAVMSAGLIWDTLILPFKSFVLRVFPRIKNGWDPEGAQNPKSDNDDKEL